MNKKLFLAALSTCSLAFCLNAFAQDARGVPGAGASIPECSTLERLDLSISQRESLQRIDEVYQGRILRNRNLLMVKRLELQGLLRDPSAGQDAIQAKADEMEGLRAALQQDMIDYQLRARDVLTPDQIRRWCTMMGHSRGRWQGDAWCR